jgi:hypothetical protein
MRVNMNGYVEKRVTGTKAGRPKSGDLPCNWRSWFLLGYKRQFNFKLSFPEKYEAGSE